MGQSWHKAGPDKKKYPDLTMHMLTKNSKFGFFGLKYNSIHYK